jgi:hypothetical protein
VTDCEADQLDLSAVEAALGLFREPSRLAWSKAAPLPSGMLTLIRLAAGDAALARQVSAATGEPVDRLFEACTFYVSGVLFDADGDHFRVLGVEPTADEATLKQHFRWLLKWLHPDRDPENWVSAYADRLNVAWNTLRRADRRAAYLQSLPKRMAGLGNGPSVPVGRTWPVRRSVDDAPTGSSRRRFRIPTRWIYRLPLIAAVSLSVVAATLIVADRVGRDLLEAPPVVDRRDAAATVSGAPESVGAVMASDEPPPPPNREDMPAPAVEGATAAAAEAAVSAASAAKGVAFSPVAVSGQTAPAPEDSTALRPLVPAPAPGPEALSDPPSIGASATSVTASVAVAVAKDDKAVPGQTPAVARAVEVSGAVSTAASDSARSQASVAGTSASAAEARARGRVAPPAVVEISAGSVAESAVEVVENAMPAPVEPSSPPAGAGELVAAAITRPGMAEPSVGGALDAPTQARSPDPAADSAREQQIRLGRRLAADFSEAYRAGDVQRIVVLFTPNARTPEGNLLDLHGAYSALFAGSTRRSMEFLGMQWQETADGLEGRGSFEWAMQPRNGFRVRSSSGPVRIVIRFVNGRPLIAELEHGRTG